MNVLVTGAAGFIGSHLCERLASMGHTVTGCDSFDPYYDPRIKRANAGLIERAGVTVLELDLTGSIDALPNVTWDAIFHLAAQPGIAGETPLSGYIRNNIIATDSIMTKARARTPKLVVYVSTSSVYGSQATGDEESLPKPISYYGVTKLAGEQLALGYCRQFRIPVCSARLFSVYGPRERPDKLFPRLIASISRGSAFPLYVNSMAHSRSFTFVGDAVRALAAMLEHREQLFGEIVNIGSDQEFTTAEAIETVEKIMGGKVRMVPEMIRIGDQLRTCANIDKAKRILSYSPAISLEQGLRESIEWFSRSDVSGLLWGETDIH